MLCNLAGEEIWCITLDTADCPVNLRTKVLVNVFEMFVKLGLVY